MCHICARARNVFPSFWSFGVPQKGGRGVLTTRTPPPPLDQPLNFFVHRGQKSYTPTAFGDHPRSKMHETCLIIIHDYRWNVTGWSSLLWLSSCMRVIDFQLGIYWNVEPPQGRIQGGGALLGGTPKLHKEGKNVERVCAKTLRFSTWQLPRQPPFRNPESAPAPWCLNCGQCH